MIQLNNISLDLGVNKIFEDINGNFQSNDRVGVIGRNGAGKSTLLKVIAGIIEPSSGEVTINKGARIAYLPQEEILASKLPVFEEAFSAFKTIFETEKRIIEIEEALANEAYSDELLEEYVELQKITQGISKHEAVKQTNEVLIGLGFTEQLLKKTVDELSTGWKMRLALAKLLLTTADMYLFDEPTNHLDIVTQQWFLQKLKNMRQGFLLVSHDRAYLEKACTSIFEIERGKSHCYKGNLSSYLVHKESQIELARSTRARQDREIAHKMEIVEKFRASASKARTAQSMLKKIEKIELVEVEPPLPTIHFHFPETQKPGRIVLNFEKLSFGFTEVPLFSGLSGQIERDERVALVAANGVGKTTLINCLTGVNKLTHGFVEFGYNVEVARFEQDQARTLNPEKTIYQEVSDACPRSTESAVRKFLGAFQFSGDTIYKKIKVLSGGEKNRVAMTKILLQNANFLILDEPTNHLDLYAKDVLLQALLAYKGTILFVSHDIDFVSKLATRIVELTPTSAHSYPGTYEEFCASKAQSIAFQSPHNTHADYSPKNKKNQNSNPAIQSEAENLKKLIQELEKTINRLEQTEQHEIEVLGKQTYGSPEYERHLEKFTKTQKLLRKAQHDWEEAVHKLENY